jgi:Skp family chaperone for outer membrane proteins
MKKLFFALIMAALLSGCETIQVQTRADRTAMTEDQLIARETQRRLAGRLETLEMEIGRLSRDLDTLRSQLENRLVAIERKSEEDKRELAARISSELDRLVQQVSAASARQAAAPSGGRGIEHVVRPGETLFIIAKAYNVSIGAVTAANQIPDPNRLSVGQKLFIPQ